MNIILYLKESPFGLKYLGKTVNQDVYKYMGSGTRWKKHILKHALTSEDIKTTILLETTDVSILKEVGEYYSDLWNIVESKDFANLRPENGDGGWGHIKGVPKTKEWKELISKRQIPLEERKKRSESQKGRKHSEESKKKMSIARSSQKDSPERIKKRADSISKVKKGKPLTELHKQALRKPKDKIKNYSTCPLCGAYTTKTVISRNHGKDKCKK
jgi:hypothetical protein